MLSELTHNEFYIDEKPNVTELLEENFADCLEGVATDTESWIHQMLVEFMGQEDFDKMISLLEYDEDDKDKIDPASLENLNSRAGGLFFVATLAYYAEKGIDPDFKLWRGGSSTEMEEESRTRSYTWNPSVAEDWKYLGHGSNRKNPGVFEISFQEAFKEICTQDNPLIILEHGFKEPLEYEAIDISFGPEFLKKHAVFTPAESDEGNQ